MQKSYRRKSSVVRAAQLTYGQPWPEGVLCDDGETKYVITIQGQKVVVNYNEWIVQESDGTHYYPIKSEVFDALYEEVPS